jgi:hypothetical protein
MESNYALGKFSILYLIITPKRAHPPRRQNFNIPLAQIERTNDTRHPPPPPFTNFVGEQKEPALSSSTHHAIWMNDVWTEDTFSLYSCRC